MYPGSKLKIKSLIQDNWLSEKNGEERAIYERLAELEVKRHRREVDELKATGCFRD